MQIKKLNGKITVVIVRWHAYAMMTFCVVVTLVSFWPGLISPFHFFEFWKVRNFDLQVVVDIWPLYAANILFSFGAVYVGYIQTKYSAPGDAFWKGSVHAMKAGLVEEVVFRWIHFFAAMIAVQAVDWLTLGFVDMHLVAALFTKYVNPIVDMLTLGYLEEQLIHMNWTVGAGMILANAYFAWGHQEHKVAGVLFAWFVGLFLFWVMFIYGLPLAIVVHFTINFVMSIAEALYLFVARKMS